MIFSRCRRYAPHRRNSFVCKGTKTSPKAEPVCSKPHARTPPPQQRSAPDGPDGTAVNASPGCQPSPPNNCLHTHPRRLSGPVRPPVPGSRFPLTACRLPRPAPPPPVFRGHGCRTGLPPFPSRILPFHGCVSRLRPLPDSCAAIAPYSHEAACLPACLPVRNRSPAADPSPAPHTLSAGAQKNKAGPLRMEQPRMQTDPQGN